MIRLEPGLRKGCLRLPQSKSHAHRVLIADFLASGVAYRETNPLDCDDILATKRCLASLAAAKGDATSLSREKKCVHLLVGESGTTRRLLGPVVAALGLTPEWKMEGRLASRPQIEYADLKPGVHTLPGDVSSQFVSGLLLALPLAKGDSEIRLSSPLASRGYVDMTLDVLKTYGISVTETEAGFCVLAGRYVLPSGGVRIESDWSGAAFPLALNALGNEIEFPTDGLSDESRQPDRVVREYLTRMTIPSHATGMSRPLCVDVDACPDLFPVLTVVAAAQPRVTRFTGIRRLRLKESDRVAAMADVLSRFGVAVDVADDAFVVHGMSEPFKGGEFSSYADHRIAMSIAVGVTRAAAPVVIDNETCAAKSYPTFFDDMATCLHRYTTSASRGDCDTIWE